MLTAFKEQSKIQFVEFTDDSKEKWLVVEYMPDSDKDCSELIEKIVKDIETLLQDGP